MATFFGENSSGISGFYDSTIMDIPSGAVAVSEDAYSALLKAEYAGAVLSIENGGVVARDYTGTLIDLASVTKAESYGAPVPLKTQAETALANARAYVSNNYTMLNEGTPDVWVNYLKALMAITSGTDTTSAALPTLPTVSTDYTLTGASTGIVGAALTLTVTPNNSGPAAATTVTLTDGDTGGTFSPATVTLAAWAATAQTVTYTPKAAGTVSISATNSGSLANPAALGVVVSAAA